MRRRRVSVSPSYMWAIVDSYGRIRAVTKTRFYARHFKRSDEVASIPPIVETLLIAVLFAACLVGSAL